MELEELKNRWTAVEERLKKQELLNTRMVEEMLKNRSKEALRKLINGEIMNVAMAVIVILFFAIVALYRNPFAGLSFEAALTIVCIVISLSSGIDSCYLLMKYLTKIDFAKNIKGNTLLISQYSAFYKKGKKSVYFIVTPVVFLLLALFYYELGALTHWFPWIVLIVALLMTVGLVIWIYKVIEKNTQTIKESLIELSEFEE
jgi:hypothetical protein